jgi:putative ABC transport system substrate-binding protein
MQATQAINPNVPVVFTSVTVPVRSANNVTGICAVTAEFDRRRLSLLQELMPAEQKFGVLYNSDRFPAGTPNTQKTDLDDAAAALGLQPPSYKDVGNGAGGSVGQIMAAFQAWPTENPRIRGALVAADSFFNNHRPQVINAARNQNIPTVYQWREFVDAGGLMSFGPKLIVAYKLAAIYTARILRNEKTPIGLPIHSLSEFELVINLATAKTLNLSIPESLLARATDIVTR